MKVDQKEMIDEFGDNLKLDYDLKKKNWFNIGGKTKAFYKADNLKELIKFLKKIQDKEKLILGFMNYLEDLKKILWKESNSIDAVEKEIDQFSLKFSEKSEQKAESSLSNWLETIPFPLASILRTWQATEKGDHKARYQHLLHLNTYYRT